MSFTLTFQSISEKVPSHGQEIIFLDTSEISSEFCRARVFYTWEDDNGTSWPYEGESEFIFDDGTKPDAGEEIRLIFYLDLGN